MMGKRILILGASGFVGNVLYKELLSYFDVYGTYCSPNDFYDQNEVFFRFDAATDDVETLLNKVKPNVIISCLKGNFKDLIEVHKQLMAHTMVTPHCRLIFISTAQVFDGAMHFPAKETDKPLSISQEGKYAIAVEKIIKELPEKKYAILRSPMILGVNAPIITQLKEAIKNKTTFEVCSDLVVNVASDSSFSQQVHYIVNQKKTGTFHIGSTDLIHHSDLFEEITEKLGTKKPIFKQVFESNKDRFLTVLPEKQTELKEHQFTVNDVIDEITLNEGILTLKTTLI
ncbi:MAG: sugar nucleotide-binding protein [Flavobacteriaceae bacterium]